MFEPLKRAKPLSQVPQQPVIPVPGDLEHKRTVQLSLSLLLLVAMITMATQFWAQRENDALKQNELGSRLSTLEKKHATLLDLIQKEDKYLDTRVQLDVIELRSDLRSLASRIDSLDPSSVETLKKDSAALRDYVKTEIYFMQKRFHTNERDHSDFYKRLESLETRAPAAAEPAA